MKSQSFRYLAILAAAAVLYACDNSSSTTSSGGTNDCGGCAETQVCAANGKCYDDAACANCAANEVCVSGSCYDESSKCGKCDPDQICKNEQCFDEGDPCAECKSNEVCKNKQCIDKDDPCLKCKSGQVCNNGVCYDSGNPCAKCGKDETCFRDACVDKNSPCLECKDDEVCKEDKCVVPTDPCDLCKSSDSCVNGECIACPNAVCSQDGVAVCCAAGELCDTFTGECNYDCGDGQPACDSNCCDADMFCAEGGYCDRHCDFGNSCGMDRICCGEDQQCLNDERCAPKCDAPRVLCGTGEAEVCCPEGDVCLKDKCVKDCTSEQTRCGADQNLCCNNADQICIFNKCLTRGKSCEKVEDCELWQFCDSASHSCVDTDEDDTKCIYKPPVVDKFSPTVKWFYKVPDANGIVQTPIVINLTDDNDDGFVNEKDIPDVVFIDNKYTLTALSGDDGHLHARSDATSSGRITYNRHNELSAADVDGDGEVEILAPAISSTLANSKLYGMALRKSGNSYTWFKKYEISPPTNANFGFGNGGIGNTYWSDYHPSIANIDGKGNPEIVTTVGVLKGDDWSKWLCTYKMPIVSTWYMSFFAVADLDEDGTMEIINTDIYHGTPANGSTTCDMILDHTNATQSQNKDGSANSTSYWYVAVADLIDDENDPNHPGELKPEIVRVRSGKVSAWKVYHHNGVWKQRLIWETDQSTSVGGGNPVIADFDGDGYADVGVAGECAYSVFNGQTGQMVWASQTVDYSSNKTGSSVFDFEGDGVAEVVYRDEQKLRVYSGKPSGEMGTVNVNCRNSSNPIYKQFPKPTILLELANTSGTVIENPIVVDVDNDGKTELVVVDEGTPSKGITVYKDSHNNWVRTRRIWNQHAYHVTNINEDGSVPLHEQPNWRNKRLNTYRANTQPDDVFNAPNFVPGDLKIEQDCPNYKLTATIKNEGSLSVKGVWVSFYIRGYDKGDGSKDDLLLGSVQLNSDLVPGGSADVTFTWDLSGTLVSSGTKVEKVKLPQELSFSVDDAPGKDGSAFFHECVEDNNDSSSYSFEACKGAIN
ncbi:MAG: hypothetical protein IJU23_12270 [Proteobacteria bacterium]|nr:hypothetical protein [Pseudomonadota bacterium]